MASVVLVLCGASSLASPDDVERPRLRVAWSDPGGVLEHGLLARGRKTSTRELARIFDAAGIDVSWRQLTHETDPRRESLIVVVLVRFDGTRWKLPPETLGAVIEGDGPLACVYVFEPAVSRALGLTRLRTSGHFYELGKAIGRVAAHEIVHALVPELRHGRRGLMRATLTREDLLRESLRMVPATSSAVSARLGDR